jgi:TPR repeat protein
MWFRKAADQGDAVAEFLLGDQYANGKGVPQDYGEARIWLQRAAEQGHSVAKLYLGGHVRRRPRRSAGLCSCPHVVQSIGGTG